MAKAKASPADLVLRLYVAGNAPNSLLAVVNARLLCDRHFAFQHRLEIIDVLDHPARAMADQIVVTPTLLKLSPLPVQRVIGNLSNTSQLLLALAGK